MQVGGAILRTIGALFGAILLYLLVVIFAPGFEVPKQPIPRRKRDDETPPNSREDVSFLVDGLRVRYLVVGDDFHFGRRRRGDFAMLVEAGKKHGFKVVNMHTLTIDDERVSSTRIRAALERGDLAQTEKLLGRPYRMCGRVAHGDKLGRTLGFPTANIYLHRKMTPIKGIFAVEVFGLKTEPLPGAANIGTRPTVGGTRTLLEVHLLDFSDDIYGAYVHVNFLHKFRDEKRFDSLDELRQWIEKDVVDVRAFFQGYHPGRIKNAGPEMTA